MFHFLYHAFIGSLLVRQIGPYRELWRRNFDGKRLTE